MRLLVQLVLCVVLFLGSSSARYHDKTRFDRSIHYGHHAPRIVDQKPRIFTDPESHYTAYKDAAMSICYLEKTRNNELDDSKLWKDVVQNNRKKIQSSIHSLTKIEAWRLAGGRIVDFCKGMKMVPLVERKPVILEHDPFFNELPEDENDVFEKRMPDVMLEPLKVRARRQAILEEQLKHLQDDQQRKKREARRGQFRGQTQSQYMNADGNKDGKAEAKADQQSSHALVSGSSGMGQAQSMSMGSECEGCATYTLPGSIQSSMLGANRGIAPGGQTGTYPSGVTSDGNSAINPGTIVYPGLTPGTAATGGGDTRYPSGGIPGANVPPTVGQVGGTIPGFQFTPGQSTPNTQQGGNRPSVQAPTGSYPSGAVPESQGSRSSGSGSNGKGSYPNTSTGSYIPQTTTGQSPGSVSVTYPGIPQGYQTSQTGTIPQGSMPGTQPTDGRGYPSTQSASGGPMNQIYPGTYLPSPQNTQATGVPGAQAGNSLLANQGSGGNVYPTGPQGIVPPSTASGMQGGGGGQGIVGPGGVMYYPAQTQWPGGFSYPSGSTPGIGPPGGNLYPQNTGATTMPQGSSQYPQNIQTMPGTPQLGPGTTYGFGTPGIGGSPSNQITGGSLPMTQGGTGPQVNFPNTNPPSGSLYIPGGPSGGIVPGMQGSAVYPSNGQYGAGSVSGSSVYGPQTQQAGQGTPRINIPVGTGGYVPQQSTGGPPGNVYPQNPIGGIAYPPSNTGAFPSIVVPGQTTPGFIPSLGQGGVGQQSGINKVPYGSVPGSLIPGGMLAPGSQGTSFPLPQLPGVNSQQAGAQSGGVIGSTYPGVNQGTSSGSGTMSAGTRTGSTVETIKPVTRGDIPGPSFYPTSQIGGTNQGIPNLVQGGSYPSGPTGPFAPPSGTSTSSGTGIMPGQYPGGQQYPGGGGVVGPGQVSPTGTVPGISNTGGQYSGDHQYPSGGAVTVPGAPGVSNTGIITGQQAGDQQYPGGGAVTTPGQAPVPRVVPGGEVTATSQQSGGPPGGDNGADSQALSSVKQGEGGTQASASAEGRHGTGSATSQVSGTYTGTGSFSAQAGTSDSNKSAQTQVSGGKEGARSSAQGSGGLGRSQVQVELDSDTGATSTSAQSGGWQHGTSSKVEASGQGGLADAQANGEGQTSSQAQIGFQPYHSRGDEKPNADRRDKPFRGGGTASAQSGTYRGQSQTQLQGSFHYGITYTGSSQASSGSGAAALRKPFNFTTPDEFKPYKLDDNSNATKKANKAQAVPKEQLRESSSRQTVIAIKSSPRDRTKSAKQPSSTSSPVKSVEENDEDDYEEYEDDELGAQGGQDRQRLPAPPTRQEVRVVTDGEHEISVKQRELPATRMPPASGTRSLERLGGIVKPPGSEYVSVTNSVAGKIDSEDREKNQADEQAGAKKYEHRYFTKSSTCGYFTFSCNVVYGSNGKRKICKPKLPDASSKC